MKRHLLTFAFILNTFSFVGYAQQKKIKVLIVDGFSNHDWKQTTYLVKNILESSDLFDVNISTAPLPSERKKWKSWKPKFNTYDVVIQNCNNIQDTSLVWHSRIKQKFEKYVKSGGGLYVLHSANNAFAGWKSYNDMIGLGWRNKDYGEALQIAKTGKITIIPKGEGKDTYHGPRNDEVIYKLNAHPINKDFPEAWKTPHMELYKFARGPAKQLTVLSYAKDDATNINWPVDWIVTYGEGRVYNSSMGHLWKGETYPDSYRCIGFQTTLIRATEWLAKGNVTYKVPEDFPTSENIKLYD